MELSVMQYDSILGTTLFYVYTLSLGHIFNFYGLFYYCLLMTLKPLSFSLIMHLQ